MAVSQTPQTPLTIDMEFAWSIDMTRGWSR